MSACATGCGEDTGIKGGSLCGLCRNAWVDSPEFDRFNQCTTPEASDVARMDFCNRVRAERQNGAPHAG